MSSKFQPALLGGLVLGVLSALPLVNAGNACCCLWVLAGGALAAYLLQNRQPAPITPADGATVGLLAGLIGAVIWQALEIPIALAMGPFLQRLMERMLDNAGDLPEGVRPFIESMRRNAGFGVIRFVVGFFFTLVVSMVFSTVGGLIGAALFRKKPPVGGAGIAGPVEP